MPNAIICIKQSFVFKPENSGVSYLTWTSIFNLSNPKMKIHHALQPVDFPNSKCSTVTLGCLFISDKKF